MPQWLARLVYRWRLFPDLGRGEEEMPVWDMLSGSSEETTIWTLRRDPRSGYVVANEVTGQMSLVFPSQNASVRLSRRDSRLLARRITQCLNEWGKKSRTR